MEGGGGDLWGGDLWGLVIAEGEEVEEEEEEEDPGEEFRNIVNRATRMKEEIISM